MLVSGAAMAWSLLIYYNYLGRQSMDSAEWPLHYFTCCISRGGCSLIKMIHCWWTVFLLNAIWISPQICSLSLQDPTWSLLHNLQSDVLTMASSRIHCCCSLHCSNSFHLIKARPVSRSLLPCWQPQPRKGQQWEAKSNDETEISQGRTYPLPWPLCQSPGSCALWVVLNLWSTVVIH